MLGVQMHSGFSKENLPRVHYGPITPVRGRGFCIVCNLILSTKAKANFWNKHQIFCHDSCRKFYKPPTTLVYRVKGAATTPLAAPTPNPSRPPAVQILKPHPLATKPIAAQAPTPVNPPASPAALTSSGPQASRNPHPAVAPAPVPVHNAQPRITAAFPKQHSAAFVELSVPSFDLIFQSEIFVKTYIPISCVKQVAKAFNFAVEQVLLKNDVMVWKQLFALPRCIMSVVPKASSSSQPVILKDVFTKRVDLFLQGKWPALFAEAKQNMVKLKLNGIQSSNLEKLVISKVEQGNISAAYRLLDSNGVHDIQNPAILQKLHDLHPTADQCSYSFKPQGATNFKTSFGLSEMEKSVFSFPKGTSAGPDGLSAQHLKDLLKFNPIGSSFDIRPSLQKLLEFIAAGKAAVEVAKYFACARLIPLKKKDNGVRPIAIGLTLRRLASKLLLSKINDKIKLENQFGIGFQNGMDTVIHATRLASKLFAVEKDFAIFQMDIINAFNTISRNLFMEDLKADYDELFPFVNWVYGNNPVLFIHGTKETVCSSNGVQQGDPLAPFLFSVALKKFLKTHIAKLKFNWNYLDDGLFGGSTELLDEFIRSIMKFGPENGIAVNLTKSNLFWPHASRTNDALFDERITRSYDGLNVLGTPVGSKSFIENQFEDRTIKRRSKLEKLKKIDDPQVVYTLLSNCETMSRINQFVRTTLPENTSTLSSNFDADVVETVENFIGTLLSNQSKRQMELPMRLGGLGLRSTVKHTPAAFLSSLNFCRDLIMDFFVDLQDEVEKLFSLEFDSIYLKHKDMFLDFTESALMNVKKQKILSEKIDNFVLESFQTNANTKDQARLLSFSGLHGSIILKSPLSKIHGYRMEKYEFANYLKLRIGLPVDVQDEFCALCHHQTKKDSDGFHSLTCGTGAGLTERHNEVRDIIADFCSKAILAPIKEMQIPGEGQIPGDVFLPRGKNGAGDPIALDITIVHPHGKKYIKNAAVTADYANIEKSKAKSAKYEEACKRHRINFQPMSFEVSGRPSPNSMKWINLISKSVANRQNRPVSVIKKMFLRKICFCIAKCNARAIRNRQQLQMDL